MLTYIMKRGGGENPICKPRVTKRGKEIRKGRDIDSDEESAERREREKIAHQHGKPRGMWEYVAIKRPWVKIARFFDCRATT